LFTKSVRPLFPTRMGILEQRRRNGNRKSRGNFKPGLAGLKQEGVGEKSSQLDTRRETPWKLPILGYKDIGRGVWNSVRQDDNVKKRRGKRCEMLLSDT